MFILLMQFVWKYIDDFMGKGLPYEVIAELLFYASANLVPMALPLAVLLSSIMTFGNLAENYELVAMKSAGLGLLKIFQPMIVFIGFLAVGAFYFSNNISPEANLRFKSLLWDITQAKPTLELKEQVFYNGLDGYSIRVMEKEEETNMLYDVLIYDHTQPQSGNRTVIRAKEGEMGKSQNGQYLVLNLYNGVSYQEMWDRTNRRYSDYPQMKTEFKKDVMRIDLSGLTMKRSDKDLWKNHMQMMSMGQLDYTIDSLKTLRQKRTRDFQNYMNRNTPLTKVTSDSASQGEVEPMDPADALNKLSPANKKRAVAISTNLARNARNFAERTKKELKGRDTYIAEHWIEWHRKLTLSFACIVLFFIGAPLGAIIKKGGLGLPVVISVILFLVYHITSLMGEKMAETGVLLPVVGMWMSTALLFPLSIYLTYKAANDAKVLDRDTYVKLYDRVVRIFKKKSSFAT